MKTQSEVVVSVTVPEKKKAQVLLRDHAGGNAPNTLQRRAPRPHSGEAKVKILYDMQ